MNSHFPNSPEDKLLDELLREQAHGPDEAFLKQLEAALDADSPKALNRPAPRRYGRFAIAAGIGLAAGTTFFIHLQNRSPDRALAVLSESSMESLSVDEASKLRDSIREQEDIVEEKRKAMTTIVRTKGIIPTGEGSLYQNQAEAVAANEGNIFAAEKLPKPVEPVAEVPADQSRDSEPPVVAQTGRQSGPAPARMARPAVGGMFGMTRGLDSSTKSKDALSGGGGGKGGEKAPDSISNDRYGTFIDQPWKSPNSDPLSTFSIDVDTASYSNVRRMIMEGREVPKDAVRIEECINAFSYKYDQPKGDGPFAVGATLAACPWNPSHQLVRVAIKGREIEKNKRPASNLVFLVDVSGSMQSPDKLPLLKQSMATMVEELDERDRVAIVVYAGTEGVALPSTRLDAEGKATVLKTLGKLEAGGSTNGGAGIKRAYELAMQQKIEGGVNRVILATDGDFNVGVTGQPALVELVKDRAKSGVYLTVVGFGTGNLNDAMMDAITHDGNGNYFYIDSDREGRKVFLQNLSGTLVTIAKDVKIQVEFNPAKVGSYRLIGYANRVLKNEDFNNDKVDAGDIGAGHTVTAFYELTGPGEGAGTDALKYRAAPEKPAASPEWLTVKLRHKHPDGDESSKTEFSLTGEVQALDKTEPEFQFATAVALFGMKLRNMDEVRDFGWDKVIALATPGLANDASEDRAEFVGLVKKLAGTVKVLPEPAEVIQDQARQVLVRPSRVLQSDEDFNQQDGPNVRVMTLGNGGRAVHLKSADGRSLTRKAFTAAGVLESISVFRLDERGNPLSAKLYDGTQQELFRVSFGYRKSDGKLIELRMFDSRQKQMDVDGVTELPVLRKICGYDPEGKMTLGPAIIVRPAIGAEEAIKSGIEPMILDGNPFDSEPMPVPAPQR